MKHGKAKYPGLALAYDINRRGLEVGFGVPAACIDRNA